MDRTWMNILLTLTICCVMTQAVAAQIQLVGTVTRQGQGLEGVAVRIGGTCGDWPGITVPTNGFGHYEAEAPASCTFVFVTPTHKNYNFNPFTRIWLFLGKRPDGVSTLGADFNACDPGDDGCIYGPPPIIFKWNK